MCGRSLNNALFRIDLKYAGNVSVAQSAHNWNGDGNRCGHYNPRPVICGRQCVLCAYDTMDAYKICPQPPTMKLFGLGTPGKTAFTYQLSLALKRPIGST
jgi:hypothetical protein